MVTLRKYSEIHTRSHHSLISESPSFWNQLFGRILACVFLWKLFLWGSLSLRPFNAQCPWRVYYTIRLNCMKRAVFGGQKPSDMVQLSTFNYHQTFLMYLIYLFLWQTLGLQSWPDRHVFTTFLWDHLFRVSKWDTQDWMKIPPSPWCCSLICALGTGILLSLKVLMGLL